MAEDPVLPTKLPWLLTFLGGEAITLSLIDLCLIFTQFLKELSETPIS